MKVTKLSPPDVAAFVSKHRLVVVYVGTTDPPSTVFDSLKASHNAHGAHVEVPAGVDEPRSGYHIFVEGKRRAFHPGLIDVGDGWPAALGFGVALVGTLWAKSDELTRAGIDLLYAQASARVIAEFSRVLGGGRRTESTPPPPPVGDDELRRAFRILGLQPTASRAEIKRRFRELARAEHPDVAANDAETQRAANLRMAQLNAAYQVILDSLPEDAPDQPSA